MSQEATVFEFTSQFFEPLKKRVIFNYTIKFSDKKSLSFTEILMLPKTPTMRGIPNGLIEKMLQSLHIILGISYYKLYCPPRITMPYKISEQEARFWNSVYKNGLGEFFYKNNLNPNIAPKFPFQKNIRSETFKITKPVNKKTHEKFFVGIGGGKDSIVAAELLKEGGFDVAAFVVDAGQKNDLQKKIIAQLGVGETRMRRFLDPKIFEPHRYSGHIPISAIYAFLGVFAAVLYQRDYVVVGNEYSSNFGNINYRGLTINHQWSKSFAFETLFQNYVNNFLTPDIRYFSLLRPFYEIRIAKLFSQYKKYFPYFSSCNSNFTLRPRVSTIEGRGLWCNNCPKCVFVFTILSAFLPKRELLGIFGKNLYQEKQLLLLFRDVLGLGTIKPFDCVGTFEESQSAFSIAGKRFANDFIIKELWHQIRFYPKALKTQKESAVPERFKFLGMEKALILGYGKEGKATKQYLKKNYPGMAIGIGDETQGSDYLKKQEKFDIAVKTPGIKKELVTIPYTTATNIFFSHIKGKYLIIGVTGSKGKSTTATLIFEMLKAGGKRAELLGNIGKPMISILQKPIAAKTIFVLELSSYQLDDIAFSPDITVVTNLFPEHMDYHGNFESYQRAKKNIINFQEKGDWLVYNPRHPLMKEWLKEYQGKATPFATRSPLKEKEIPLKGAHNTDNIRAAVAVAKIMGVSDALIKRALRRFKPLPHRLELVGTFEGIIFYNDASSTNPESAVLAIEALKNIDTILLGGQDRGYDFLTIGKNDETV